jgi:hypothetical protein
MQTARIRTGQNSEDEALMITKLGDLEVRLSRLEMMLDYYNGRRNVENVLTEDPSH